MTQLSLFTLTATQADRPNLAVQPVVLSTNVQFISMAVCLGRRPEKVDESGNNYDGSDNYRY